MILALSSSLLLSALTPASTRAQLSGPRLEARHVSALGSEGDAHPCHCDGPSGMESEPEPEPEWDDSDPLAPCGGELSVVASWRDHALPWSPAGGARSGASRALERPPRH